MVMEFSRIDASIAFCANVDNETNKITLESLIKQDCVQSNLHVQIIIGYVSEEFLDLPELIILQENYEVIYIPMNENREEFFEAARMKAAGEWFTVIEGGDSFPEKYISNIMKYIMKEKKIGHNYKMAMAQKRYVMDGSLDLCSKKPAGDESVYVIDFEEKYDCVPHFLAGTWFHKDYFSEMPFIIERPEEFEKNYCLQACLKYGKMLYFVSLKYNFSRATETDISLFPFFYERSWYYEVFDEYWIPFLQNLEQKLGRIPLLVQYQLMYTLRCRLESNVNNKNKHVVPDEEAEDYLVSWTNILKFIDDQVILNRYRQGNSTGNNFFKRMLLRIKYLNPNLAFKTYSCFYNDKIWFGVNNYLCVEQKTQKINILFMEKIEDQIYIDATISSLYDINDGELYVSVMGGVRNKISVDFNQRYSHVKVFGTSVYKRNSFSVSIPITNSGTDIVKFEYKNSDCICSIPIQFESHTSRLTDVYKNSYWAFDEEHIMTVENNSLMISCVDQKTKLKYEEAFQKELAEIGKTDKRVAELLKLRKEYFRQLPNMKNRMIWLFIDKIYKAGDSSEYLFKYARKIDDRIEKYYLIDEEVPDGKRLMREGVNVVFRGSLEHKLAFLFADMVIISNSTVFAFNGYTLADSACLRDLFHFHVACVQHGMSVQKIAIAQNRLRDNIRLYFCASKYEIENLSRPVYDYIGHDALKLTGVPRHDGLVNNDQRQILISPTWRMQAALPVEKNSSESVARDYNPLFKETSYYEVYNSLINNHRLINAARKYNYKIKYVLHPIVSPQVDDFEKNDYVEIIPSTGDMSYEKVFCESSLMVTDFSGVQFDFAYMRKPVVYLHHDAIPQHYEEGTFHYDTMAFGEICHNNDELIDVLIEYMKNNCEMKDEYKMRADDFFEYSDQNNCERIYVEMIEYMKKKGLYQEEAEENILIDETDLTDESANNKLDFRVMLFKPEGITLGWNKLDAKCKYRIYRKDEEHDILELIHEICPTDIKYLDKEAPFGEVCYVLQEEGENIHYQEVLSVVRPKVLERPKGLNVIKGLLGNVLVWKDDPNIDEWNIRVCTSENVKGKYVGTTGAGVVQWHENKTNTNVIGYRVEGVQITDYGKNYSGYSKLILK